MYIPNKYIKLLFSRSPLLLFGATTGSGPLLCVPHDPGKLPAQFGLLAVVQLLAQQWDVGIGIRPPRPLHIATGSFGFVVSSVLKVALLWSFPTYPLPTCSKTSTSITTSYIVVAVHIISIYT